MASQKNFKQGEDVKISVSVTESPAIDFSTASDVKAIVSVGGVAQSKYSLATATGYGKLEVDTTNKNQINIFALNVDTQNFPTGKVSVNLVAFLPNTAFPDGGQRREWDFNTGRVTEGFTKDELIDESF